MIISDINYIETADLEVQGGFLPWGPAVAGALAFTDANANAFGTAFSYTATNTFSNVSGAIGAKNSLSLAQSVSAGLV